MTDEINLLDEISDDPDDVESDYGRGFAAGRKQAAVDIRKAQRQMRMGSAADDAFTAAARIAEAETP